MLCNAVGIATCTQAHTYTHTHTVDLLLYSGVRNADSTGQIRFVSNITITLQNRISSKKIFALKLPLNIVKY